MAGVVRAIYISPIAKGEMIPLEIVALQKGRGIIGDRYYEECGTFSERLKGKPDTEVTLVESEQIEQFSRENGFALNDGDLRRNLVTKGIDLNKLVGVRFKVGITELEGIRLCEPCLHIANLLGKEVLEKMVHKAGLRAKIIIDGPISIGDDIKAYTSV